jgi:hypothetical protein
MHDGLGECTMHDSGISEDHRLLRREQFKASEKKRRVALFETMFRDFDNVIANLDGQIATEKDRTRIKYSGHPCIFDFRQGGGQAAPESPQFGGAREINA